MDFFQAQEDARRRTGRLVLLFAAAVSALLILTNGLVALAYLVLRDGWRLVAREPLAALVTIPIEIWLTVTLGVVGTVGLACGYKFVQLRGGGRVIAEGLDGRQILPASDDRRERRLLNVVEEMALAAGLPVPPVYLVSEPGINAFAAGFGPDDAVLGITQGALDALDRDELQGVVAHELSHLLSGDTRINLRLIAVLHGILFVALLGGVVVSGRGRAGRGDGRGNAGPLVLLGVGLLVIGFGGTFFANLIKAAVSRQREYLADGAAVQFTRNPDGIANALKKIGGSDAGSVISDPWAEQASHMLFAEGVNRSFGRMMATHPTLPDRIRAIEPNWDGEFIEPASATPLPASATADSTAPASDAREAIGTLGGHVRLDLLGWHAAGAPDTVGNPDESSRLAAVAVLESTPEALLAAAHEPLGARCLCYALLLSQDDSVRAMQMERIGRSESVRTRQQVQALQSLTESSDDLHRLALLEVAMPALKSVSASQHQQFLRLVNDLVQADKQLTLFEWVMHRLLEKALRPHFDRPRVPRRQYRHAHQVAEHCGTLLSAIACNGDRLAPARERAFAVGASTLKLPLTLDVRSDPGFERLDRAVAALLGLLPSPTRELIEACAATVLSDEIVTVAEGALLQGLLAALNCPLPPAMYVQVRDRIARAVPGGLPVSAAPVSCRPG